MAPLAALELPELWSAEREQGARGGQPADHSISGRHTARDEGKVRPERKKVDSRQRLSAGPALRAGGRSGPEVTGICTLAACCLLPPAGPETRTGSPEATQQRTGKHTQATSGARARAEVLTAEQQTFRALILKRAQICWGNPRGRRTTEVGDRPIHWLAAKELSDRRSAVSWSSQDGVPLTPPCSSVRRPTDRKVQTVRRPLTKPTTNSTSAITSRT